MYDVKIVADSLSPQGHRLTSMLVTMPRIILAELNTHRMFSRNSASSRAIPFNKMVQSVQENPFIPLRWMKEHSGMQGTEYFEAEDEIHLCKETWLAARKSAINQAVFMHESGITKQVCNRLLEPFMWHTVLITATEWENFYAQRVDPAAEIHMQHIATMMLEAQNASVPRKLAAGDWHIPFALEIYNLVISRTEFPWLETMLKVSTMMCARTSYTTAGDELGEWTVEKYLEKFALLQASGHWSPFEHCARVMSESEYTNYHISVPHSEHQYAFTSEYGWCGNFRGFIQYRKTFENENRSDNRLIKQHE